MSKIKKKKDTDIVSAKDVKYRCKFSMDHDTILFSFKYMTNQKEFNWQKFKNSGDLRKDISILNEFHERLDSMSKGGWEDLRTRSKDQGGRELLDYSQIYFSAYDPRNDLKLTKDSKCMVVRFGGKKYRLIGYRSKLCPSLFHVIGFDFAHNAYNHGN